MKHDEIHAGLAPLDEGQLLAFAQWCADQVEGLRSWGGAEAARATNALSLADSCSRATLVGVRRSFARATAMAALAAVKYSAHGDVKRGRELEEALRGRMLDRLREMNHAQA